MRHFFAQPIRFDLTLHAEDRGPAVLTHARLYSDTPTTDDLNGVSVGYVESVTSWESLGGGSYRLEFSGVVDSDDKSLSAYENYWIVTRFRFEAGGVETFIKNAIRLHRPTAWPSLIRLNHWDVYSVESKLEHILDDVSVAKKIENAVEDVLEYYEALGYERQKVASLHKLTQAVKYRAVAYCCVDASSEADQFWFEKAQYYMDKTKEILEGMKLDYDANLDGLIEPGEEGSKSVNFVELRR